MEDGLPLLADKLLEAGFSEADVSVMAVRNTRLMTAPATTTAGAA